MGKLLRVAQSLQLFFFLLIMSCEVNGKPTPREHVSDTTLRVRPEEPDSVSSNKTDSLRAATINITVVTVGQCYQDCNTSCNNDQCYETCNLKCNSTAGGREQRDTSFTAVKCYHNCSTSCDNDQCYQPCIFKCNSDPESEGLPTDKATPVRCYKACQATQDKMPSYKQCLSRCAGGLQTDAGFPPVIGSEVRQPSPFPQHPNSSPLPETPPVTSIPSLTALPSTTTFRSLSPIPVILSHPSDSFTLSDPSVPATPTNSSGPKTRNPAASGDLVHQNRDDKNCTSTVIFACDSNGENCIVEESSYDCEDDSSGNRDAPKSSQPPCPGLCRRRSVDGRCLKDVSCCESVFRGGPQFLSCLIDY